MIILINPVSNIIIAFIIGLNIIIASFLLEMFVQKSIVKRYSNVRQAFSRFDERDR